MKVVKKAERTTDDTAKAAWLAALSNLSVDINCGCTHNGIC